MKAKEYFEKYRDRILNESTGGDLMRELNAEIKNAVEVRHIKTDIGLVSVILEVNDKFNAIGRLFVKNGMESPLRENGVVLFYLNEIPMLAGYLPPRLKHIV